MWYARAYILVSCFYACVHAATAFCTHCTVCACASAYIYLCLCVLISVRVGPGRRMKLEDAQNVVISLKGANVHCNFGVWLEAWQLPWRWHYYSITAIKWLCAQRIYPYY